MSRASGKGGSARYAANRANHENPCAPTALENHMRDIHRGRQVGLTDPKNGATPAGNRGLTKTTVGVEMADSQHTHIRWTCDRCRFPIEDGTGVLAVPIAEISDPPEFGAVWQAVHVACADPLHDYYGIDIEKVSTHAGLIRWTAHLLSKSWITESNWDEILRESVGA